MVVTRNPTSILSTSDNDNSILERSTSIRKRRSKGRSKEREPAQMTTEKINTTIAGQPADNNNILDEQRQLLPRTPTPLTRENLAQIAGQSERDRERERERDLRDNLHPEREGRQLQPRWSDIARGSSKDVRDPSSTAKNVGKVRGDSRDVRDPSKENEKWADVARRSSKASTQALAPGSVTLPSAKSTGATSSKTPWSPESIPTLQEQNMSVPPLPGSGRNLSENDVFTNNHSTATSSSQAQPKALRANPTSNLLHTQPTPPILIPATNSESNSWRRRCPRFIFFQNFSAGLRW